MLPHQKKKRLLKFAELCEKTICMSYEHSQNIPPDMSSVKPGKDPASWHCNRFGGVSSVLQPSEPFTSLRTGNSGSHCMSPPFIDHSKLVSHHTIKETLSFGKWNQSNLKQWLCLQALQQSVPSCERVADPNHSLHPIGICNLWCADGVNLIYYLAQKKHSSVWSPGMRHSFLASKRTQMHHRPSMRCIPEHRPSTHLSSWLELSCRNSTAGTLLGFCLCFCLALGESNVKINWKSRTRVPAQDLHVFPWGFLPWNQHIQKEKAELY